LQDTEQATIRREELAALTDAVVDRES